MTSTQKTIADMAKLITEQHQEITELKKQLANTLEALDLNERLTDEILRMHYKDGGRALNIEHARIVNNGQPHRRGWKGYNNGEYTTIVMVRR